MPIWKKEPSPGSPSLKAMCPKCGVMRSILCCKYGKWVRCTRCGLDISPRNGNAIVHQH